MGLEMKVVEIGLVLWLTTSMLFMGEAVYMAKEGCEEKCGDVIIPYPFGIGYSNINSSVSCYANQSFAIECNNTVPFLTITNTSNKIKVYHISLDRRRVRVEFPVMYRNCGKERDTRVVMDFRNTPFSLRGYDNMFIALGCNIEARINNLTNSVPIIGCVSVCQELSDNNKNECGKINGMNCCQLDTEGLWGLNAFNMSLEKMDSTPQNNGCSYAFLAETGWFNSNSTYLFHGEYVPLILSWTLDTPTSNSRYCNEYSCQCKYGYEGNPYTEGGCIDIDECANSTLNHCNGTCTNVPGYYVCGYHPNLTGVFIDIFTQKIIGRGSEQEGLYVVNAVAHRGLAILAHGTEISKFGYDTED